MEKEYADDRAWFDDHPDEQERTRPLSVAEQLWVFLCSGRPCTHAVTCRCSVHDSSWVEYATFF